MSSKSSGSTRFALALPPATLLVLTLLYWKFRIIDTAVSGWISLYTGDLYNQYYPMVSYGFTALRAGHLPLWNPFQFCGVPFLAVPYVGLFYPANLIYLFVDVSTGIELLFIFHMFFAAVSIWCLQRHFGISSLGGICSALTFAWSGWLIFNANQIPLYAGMAWMPLTVLLFDRAASGQRGALMGLIAAVALQLLLGATETLVHNLHVGAFFACARLAAIVRRKGWAVFVRRGGLLAGAVAAGVLLAAFQLLPTLELTRLSNRAAGELTYADAVVRSRPVSWVVLNSMGGPADVPLGNVPFPVTGLLPFLGIFLGVGSRVSRRAWLGGLIAATVALLLVSGDPFYRLYYALPWGAIFRRPEKLLVVYQFGQALLAGVAIFELQSLRALKRSELWTRPVWLAALGLTAVLAAFVVGGMIGNQDTQAASGAFTLQAGVLLVTLALLVAYGCLAPSRARAAVIGCILVVQAANLFLATGSKTGRPVPRDLYDGNLQLKHDLRELPGFYRTYVFSSGTGLPDADFRPKEGTIHGFGLATDYESLILARYKTFLDRLVGAQLPEFSGAYPLSPRSRWSMMNLTSTRYYVADRWHPATKFIQEPVHSRHYRHYVPEFHEIYGNDSLGVYETRDAIPRAYLVPEARVLEDPNRVLDGLNDPAFDATKEVVLEAPSEQPPPETHADMLDSAEIAEYRPEEVIVETFASQPRYLVLTDAFYPGWKAFVNGVETKIYRANYLFRAVPLPAGSNTVRFSYSPASFRFGAVLSGLCASGLMLLFVLSRRSRRSDR